MNKTSIEWTQFTVNPIRFRNKETGRTGHYCEKISPGCKNCYASTMQKGPYLSGLEYIATNKDKGDLYFDDAVVEKVLRRKKPAKIFWCDMTDLFGEWVPDEWIDRCFAAMALTPWHTHQVLTKRAERMYRYFEERKPGSLGCEPRIIYWMEKLAEKHGGWMFDGIPDFPLENVWLGVSAEDQQRADERIPWLLRTPAAVRFVSAEPLLGPVSFENIPTGQGTGDEWDPIVTMNALNRASAFAPRLNLVIVGGESGPGARPCNVEWIRSIVRQCRDAGVSVFCKQLGRYPFSEQPEPKWMPLYHDAHGKCPSGEYAPWWGGSGKGGDMTEWPEDLRVRQMPEARNA